MRVQPTSTSLYGLSNCLRAWGLCGFLGFMTTGTMWLRELTARRGSTTVSRPTRVQQQELILLRTDASKQTMFILKDGAQDVTGSAGDHTYMIPEEAIDITLSPNYVDGDTFNTMEFVVEMTVFRLRPGVHRQQQLRSATGRLHGHCSRCAYLCANGSAACGPG